MNPRAACAIAASISTVSTRSMSRLCSSVWVVRPVPMPITAAVRIWGRSASGSAPVSTMVISSVPRVPPGSRLMEPSDLPLVRRLTASGYFTRCTVAVLPSLLKRISASREAASSPWRNTPAVILFASSSTAIPTASRIAAHAPPAGESPCSQALESVLVVGTI